ncbi:DUF2780 domain-containing protein [Photobacterium damselae]|uniref:DUF2780 domain-containing protein n=1 Tax=Photobacterium damselae TaxID=38293 RepID=UPI00083AD78D|nr:DUF2780 domain-containing protein [Photobacterium damselae]QSH57084.1 DUF2780 domain-containing protein [Photobacterium damselae subsp. damselae]
MNKRHTLTALAVIGMLTASTMSYAFSLSDIFGGSDVQQTTSAIANNPLTQLLTNKLGVSPQQAAGGASALLAFASSELQGDQAKELQNLIPGSKALADAIPAGLSGLLDDPSTLNKVFSILGIDSKTADEFAPVIMQFLKQQGANQNLLTTLANVWAPTN